MIPSESAPIPQASRKDPHLEMLQRVTNKLDNLSINLVQGPRVQAMEDQNRPQQRRQPRNQYYCYNCGETGHGMYYCPHPRRYNNAPRGRGNQVSPPRVRPMQQPQAQRQPTPPPMQILHPQGAPQLTAEILPLPERQEERGVNVVRIEDKVKAKMQPKVMPSKKARMSEETSQRRDNMEIEEEAGTSKEGRKQKKRAHARRQKIGIKDVPLGQGSEPYNLLEDVVNQGPKLSWPQLLQLSPKMRRQWSRMVSIKSLKRWVLLLLNTRTFFQLSKLKSRGKISQMYM